MTPPAGNTGPPGRAKRDCARRSEPAATRHQVWTRLAPARPTHVYDTYWRFAAERQAIFFRRFSGEPTPWTDDPVLAHYKFTNAYRASDRVSQFLISHVIYAGEQTAQELFFRILLFKIFNRIDTWQRLQSALGDIQYSTYRYEDYDRVLTGHIERGTAIYSPAYIMPSGNARSGVLRKHQMHLRLLERMIADRAPSRVADARSMQTVFEILRSYPTIGGFLSYQYAIDLNYSELTSFSETDFVVPGPGALSGIRKCFSSLGGLNEAEVIRLTTERQELEFQRLGLEFQSLWGRPLQYIDCQNLFCEVDKYARVFHPDVVGTTPRNRIKQVFRSNGDSLPYWYPPKWRLNDAIEDARSQDRAANSEARPWSR